MLLILAGISIATLTGDNGIINQSQNAKEETRYATIIEAKEKWELKKSITGSSGETASDVINKLYENDVITKEERDKLLEGEIIIVAEKEVDFGLSNGKLYLTLTKGEVLDERYRIIYVMPRIGGIPAFQTYEEYINPEKILETMNEEDKEEVLVEYEKTQYESYYENNYPGQEVTIELVLQDYGVSSMEEMAEEWGYNSVDEMIIYGRWIEYDLYEQYANDYNEKYIKSIEMTKPDGTTQMTTNANVMTYAVLENGIYTFTAEYEGQTVTKSIEINELEIANEYIYEIYTIEDFIKFSNSVNNGYSYDGKTVKLMKNLDFNNDSSYDNPEDKTTFEDYNEDGIVEGIKEEVTKSSQRGFMPIAGDSLWIQETYQTITYSFKGTFEGNNYQINNLYINNNQIYDIGLFANNNGIIQNLKIGGNINLQSEGSWYTYYIGGIAGNNYGTIYNCQNSVNFNVNNNRYISVGGIAGNNKIASIVKCSNLSDINIEETESNSGTMRLGGIAGTMSNVESNIKECINNGSISIKNREKIYVGGICGDFSDSGKIFNCINAKTITANNTSAANVGGILGDGYAGFVVNNYNRGDIYVDIKPNSTQESSIGGIVGDGNIPKIINGMNVGNITVTGNEKVYVGGIIGFQYWEFTIESYNIGKIEGKGENTSPICGGVAGIGHGDISGGYAENTATTGIGNYPNKMPNSMDLSIDVLLEKMNTTYANIPEMYYEHFTEEDIASWKIDTSISNTHPVLDWE